MSESGQTPHTVTIDYYSDVLCIWAWIAQRRINEMCSQYGKRVRLHYHCIDVFGDVAHKMQSQWQDRGGYAGFAEHVENSVSGFPEISIARGLWREVRPTTSANAHLLIKAMKLLAGDEAAQALAIGIREAFFLQKVDIGRLDALYSLVPEATEVSALRELINDGQAMAALMGDYQSARQLNIAGSPSYVMNHGRQVLYGNVGYRVLQANIDELLRHPGNEASWC